MRISRAEHVHSSANQATAIDQSLDWARMAKLTLLAMAASLLFLACRCQALTSTTDTNSQATVVQTPNPSSNAVAPGPEAVTQNVRVVRLSDVEGTVQIVRNNQTEFSHAVMNMPLTEGTQIETGPDGRAEIEFEDGSVTRITPNSSLTLAKLSTSSTGTLETTLDQSKGPDLLRIAKRSSVGLHCGLWRQQSEANREQHVPCQPWSEPGRAGRHRRKCAGAGDKQRNRDRCSSGQNNRTSAFRQLSIHDCRRNYPQRL